MASASHLPRPWHLAEILVHEAPRGCLYGLPGTGKTFATLSTSHPAGTIAPEAILSLTLHDDAAVSDLIGGYLPIAGKWSWRDGPAVQAWRMSHDGPVRLVLNEVDRAAGPLHTALLAILDDPASAVFTLPTGETIRPCVGNFQAVATMNGDPADLDAALRDRFDAWARVDDPHPASIAALPSDLQAAAEGLSTASARRESRGTTPRDWHSLARLISRGLDVEDAAELVWGERAAEVMQHLALLSVPPTAEEAETDPADESCTYCGEDCIGEGTPCSEAVQASAYMDSTGDYYCPGSAMFFYSERDGDGEVWSPQAGTWYLADEAECWAENVRAGRDYEDGEEA